MTPKSEEITVKVKLLDQIASRRNRLRLNVSAMPNCTGLTRQQYDKIEKGGNPSLSTLEKIAEGLGAELVLVPADIAEEVLRLIAERELESSGQGDLSDSAVRFCQVIEPWFER